MVGDPLYALGVLRQSSVGLTEVMTGAGGGSGWNGREGKDSLLERLGWGKVGLVFKGVRWLQRTDWISPR